jgi:hypothetical protein
MSDKWGEELLTVRPLTNLAREEWIIEAKAVIKKLYEEIDWLKNGKRVCRRCDFYGLVDQDEYNCFNKESPFYHGDKKQKTCEFWKLNRYKEEAMKKARGD